MQFERVSKSIARFPNITPKLVNFRFMLNKHRVRRHFVTHAQHDGSTRRIAPTETVPKRSEQHDRAVLQHLRRIIEPPCAPQTDNAPEQLTELLGCAKG